MHDEFVCCLYLECQWKYKQVF